MLVVFMPRLITFMFFLFFEGAQSAGLGEAGYTVVISVSIKSVRVQGELAHAGIYPSSGCAAIIIICAAGLKSRRCFLR
jgi:hypothetical protein